jgi:cell division transport system permease protein
MGAVALPWTSWALLAALPIAGILLSTLTGRWTVLRALGRSL